MMSFFEVLIIFLLLLAHHDFRVIYQLLHINIHFLPGIAHRYKPETDIVKFGVGSIYLLCKVFIRCIFNQYEILIACKTVNLATVEILLEHFTYAGDHFISIVPAELFIEVLQSVDIDRKRAQGFQLTALYIIQIIHQTVSVQKPGQIIMIAEIFLLLLHFLQRDRLRDIREKCPHKIKRAASSVDSRNCQDSSRVLRDLAEYTIAVRSRICDLCLHPLRLFFLRKQFQAVSLPLHIFGTPLIDHFDVTLLFFNIISVL